MPRYRQARGFVDQETEGGMTRQKKEIIKRIEELENEIAVDRELSFGCAPSGAYDSIYERLNGLREQLAKLMHFCSYSDMMDWEYVGDEADCDLPFI